MKDKLINRKNTQSQHHDFGEVPFCERSKYAVLVWAVLGIGCVSFWVWVYHLIF